MKNASACIGTHRRALPALSVFFFFFALAALGVVDKAHALLVVDDMVYVGQNAGAATLKIKNTSAKPTAYRLEWTQLRMKPGGAKETVLRDQAITGVLPAEPFMYVAPRRLIMQPDQLQHIRFMVRRTPDMQPGEYRSYIVMDPEPIPQEYGQPGGAGKQSAQLDILTGYRIPVFFLHGETTLVTSVTDARIGQNEKGEPSIAFTFKREGNRSALGEMTMKCVTGETDAMIGRMDIKVFTELSERQYNVKLDLPPTGCRSVALDYLPHRADPDYEKGMMRMADIPLQ